MNTLMSYASCINTKFLKDYYFRSEYNNLKKMAFINDTNFIRENVCTTVLQNEPFGLYITLFVTDDPLGLRDSNRDNQRGLFGKTVILPNGVSIKPGKFQSGHLARRAEDFLHLKTRDEGLNGESKFLNAFVQSYKIDFDTKDKEVLKNRESDLKKIIDDYLLQNELLVYSPRQKELWMQKYPHLNAYDFRGRQGDWRQIDCDTSEVGFDTAVEQGIQVLNDLVNQVEQNLPFL